MKTKLSLLAAIVVAGLGALTTGCYAETGYVVTNDAYTYETEYAQPVLVAAGPNVWVVRDQPSVYYSDNSYWMYSGNVWYRSRYSNRGWVVVNSAPVYVTSHYHSARPQHHHVTRRTPAQPHVAHRPARPRVVRRVETDAPSARASGSVHVKTSPSVRVHRSARPSVRVAGSEKPSKPSSKRNNRR